VFESGITILGGPDITKVAIQFTILFIIANTNVYTYFRLNSIRGKKGWTSCSMLRGSEM
jgi:hypothetical protein